VNPTYWQVIGRTKGRGVRFATIVYDLIPLTHPQWVGCGYGNVFNHWLIGVLASSELIYAISNHSRSVLLDYANKKELPVPRVEVLPLGAGFRGATELATASGSLEMLPREYVLFVSTLEPRKNHRLLLQVWRRLIDKHGALNVPHLVFAGRLGWMIDDLMAELQRSNFIDGKVVIVSNLSDGDLRNAYRNCLLSVFPSFVEGWGLPIAESLEQGKLCVASDRASIPEIGGDLVDYFDPDDEDEAIAALERAIFDGAYRRAREERIRAEYRPRSWSICVETLLGKMDGLTGSGMDTAVKTEISALGTHRLEPASR